jgi:WD40 repeat protein
VWDTASRQIYQRLPGHTGFLTGLAFHPQDARRLVTAGEDRTVRLWDVPSGREVFQLQGHTDNCSGLAFKPDGRILASASYDRSIRLWDATNIAGIRREKLQSLQFDHEAWSVVISPDGRRIAAAGLSPNLRIWDTATGHESGSFTTLFTGLLTLAFGPDGRRVAAAGFDGGVPACVVKVLDLDTGQTQTEYREGQEIFAVAFSPPAGRWLALGLRDGSVKLVDAKTGKEIAFVGKHDRGIAIGGIRFRHDGLRLASASMDGTVRIWDLTSALSSARGEGGFAAASPTDHVHKTVSSGDSGIAFWSVTFSHDGRRLITGDKDGQLTVWDA